MIKSVEDVAESIMSNIDVQKIRQEVREAREEIENGTARFYVSFDSWIEDREKEESLVCVQGCDDDQITLLLTALNFYEESLS